jgi:hypothetical protein
LAGEVRIRDGGPQKRESRAQPDYPELKQTGSAHPQPEALGEQCSVATKDIGEGLLGGCEKSLVRCPEKPRRLDWEAMAGQRKIEHKKTLEDKGTAAC